MGKPPQGRKAKNKTWTKFKRRRAQEPKSRPVPHAIEIQSGQTSPSTTGETPIEPLQATPAPTISPADQAPPVDFDRPNGPNSNDTSFIEHEDRVSLGLSSMTHHVEPEVFPFHFPSPLASPPFQPSPHLPTPPRSSLPFLHFQFTEARHAHKTTKFVLRVSLPSSNDSPHPTSGHFVKFVFVPSKQSEPNARPEAQEATLTKTNRKKRKFESSSLGTPSTSMDMDTKPSISLSITPPKSKLYQSEAMDDENASEKIAFPAALIHPISSWSTTRVGANYAKTHVRYIVEEAKGERRDEYRFSCDQEVALPLDLVSFDLKFSLQKYDERANGGKNKARDTMAGGFIGRIYCLTQVPGTEKWDMNSVSTMIMLKKEPMEALELTYRYAVWESVFLRNPTLAKFNEAHDEALAQKWPALFSEAIWTRLRTLKDKCSDRNGAHYLTFTESLFSVLTYLKTQQSIFIKQLLSSKDVPTASPEPSAKKQMRTVKMKSELFDDDFYDHSVSGSFFDSPKEEHHTMDDDLNASTTVPQQANMEQIEKCKSVIPQAHTQGMDSYYGEGSVNAMFGQSPLFGTDASLETPTEMEFFRSTPTLSPSSSSTLSGYQMDVDCASDMSEASQADTVDPRQLVCSSSILPPLSHSTGLVSSPLDEEIHHESCTYPSYLDHTAQSSNDLVESIQLGSSLPKDL